MGNAPRVNNVNFNISVGTVVPRTVRCGSVAGRRDRDPAGMAWLYVLPCRRGNHRGRARKSPDRGGSSGVTASRFGTNEGRRTSLIFLMPVAKSHMIFETTLQFPRCRAETKPTDGYIRRGTMNRFAMIASVLLISGGMAGAAAAQQSTSPSQPKPPTQYDNSGAPVQPEPGKPNAASPVPPDETTGQAQAPFATTGCSRPPKRAGACAATEELPRPIPR